MTNRRRDIRRLVAIEIIDASSNSEIGTFGGGIGGNERLSLKRSQLWRTCTVASYGRRSIARRDSVSATEVGRDAGSQRRCNAAG
jgi:hypothetical protein